MIVRTLPIIVFWTLTTWSFSQVQVTVDLSAPTHPVSPYLYGRNNSVSDNPADPLTAGEWRKLRDAGIRFLRESGGNNSTKYNWRRKLSSHPDWYNNVYPHDWDFAARSIQENLPNAQGMWSFQLIGKAAKTTAANFNDWDHNGSVWWPGVRQNLAGGGVLDPDGDEAAQQDGNPDLYLENWSADSTVGILDSWFGPAGIGLDPARIAYWNMDNEAEIWHGTHDDVMPTQIPAEQFMQAYFAVAKKAREKYPAIKLVGPVTANEWQWYNWGVTPVYAGGVPYPWLEFFIKRIAEEQEISGLRLLDVLDIHFYPSGTAAEDVVQYHRVFFDKEYVFPEANGVKNVNGSWNDAERKEYIFERCREWLAEYIGPDHRVTFSVTETGIPDIGPNGIAVWYGSTIGEFMRHPDMEIFAPWHWYPVMWEVVHLFSHYNKQEFVKASSSDETLVSAYPTINAAQDSITLILVNRATTEKSATVRFNGFALGGPAFETLSLNGLSATETFVSHQSNALKKSAAQKTGNTLSLSLAPMSITSVLLAGARDQSITATEDAQNDNIWEVFPNPSTAPSVLQIKIYKTGHAQIDLVNPEGNTVMRVFTNHVAPGTIVETDLSGVAHGPYLLRLKIGDETYVRKVIH